MISMIETIMLQLIMVKKEETMMMANAQTILAVIRIMMIDIKHNKASTDLLVTCARVSVVGLGPGARFAVECPFAVLAVVAVTRRAV